MSGLQLLIKQKIKKIEDANSSRSQMIFGT